MTYLVVFSEPAERWLRRRLDIETPMALAWLTAAVDLLEEGPSDGPSRIGRIVDGRAHRRNAQAASTGDGVLRLTARFDERSRTVTVMRLSFVAPAQDHDCRVDYVWRGDRTSRKSPRGDRAQLLADVSPGLAERIPDVRPSRSAVRVLDVALLVLRPEIRSRYAEEIRAELFALAETGAPGRVQLAFALQLARSVGALRTATRPGGGRR